MSPEQLADVLVGIARAQAAMAEALASATPSTPWQKTPAWQSLLVASGVIQTSPTAVDPTLMTLPAKLAELAASPGSYGEQNLQAIARSEIARLTQQAQP